MTIRTNEKTDLSLPISQSNSDWLKSMIRDIPDFPKPGIIFKDLTTLFKDAKALAFAIDVLTEKCRSLNPDVIAGIEARGFILAPAIAYQLGLGFVPVRKPGKLPYQTHKIDYDLEYGTDSIEVHIDAAQAGNRVVLIDDLLATGGTAAAAKKLLEVLGANVVGVGFIVELAFLSGRKKLDSATDVFAMVKY